MVSRKNYHGFTLIELAIAVAVACVASAIAIPNIISWLPEMRLKSAARDLYSNMAMVRMNAVKENKPWSIIFDIANNRYFLCDDQGVDGTWIGAGDMTGTGDNSIVATYCMDGSLFAADPRNCTQRESGIVLGHGDATIAANDGGAIPADNVGYANNNAVFNPRGTGSGGYVYLEHERATTSFAVGTPGSGVIRIFKSPAGAAGYE